MDRIQTPTMEYLKEKLPIGPLEPDEQAKQGFETIAALHDLLHQIVPHDVTVPFKERLGQLWIANYPESEPEDPRRQDMSLLLPLMCEAFGQSKESQKSFFFDEVLMRITSRVMPVIVANGQDMDTEVKEQLALHSANIAGLTLSHLFEFLTFWVIDNYVQRLCPEADFMVNRFVVIQFAPNPTRLEVKGYQVDALRLIGVEVAPAAGDNDQPAES